MKQFDANGNEILGKYSEEERKEWYLLFAEIAFLAAKINNETDLCVFFDYSGHVNHIRLKVCVSKKRYNEELVASEFGVVIPKDEEPEDYMFGRYNWTQLKEMKQKKAFLAYILERQEIPYDSAIREEITHIEEVWSF